MPVEGPAERQFVFADWKNRHSIFRNGSIRVSNVARLYCVFVNLPLVPLKNQLHPRTPSLLCQMLS